MSSDSRFQGKRILANFWDLIIQFGNKNVNVAKYHKCGKSTEGKKVLTSVSPTEYGDYGHKI
ncbi:hypothetical protein EPI10_019001 [Gossypium australe]|uniref:Uncharacterized protein n=1 Tax=Gossypium australe TaxID=47621 RepID=A0A5B6UIJ6_9ROSI|nr:hypothetical protein EPI10_019001 [Gossypium australe]